MNYTLQNIHTAKSYKALLRNGFTDIEVVAYYGTPKADRGVMLIQIKAEVQRKKFNTPKPNINIVAYTTSATKEKGTQMCTEVIVEPKYTDDVSVDSVREMALEYMEKDWVYRGQTFNLSKLGWTFFLSEKKGANGTCYYNRRKICLSQWVIENSHREMSGWVNTMVHEIAHAINNILGGRNHDWQWKSIFLSFGGSGERCSSDIDFIDLIKNPISKYTLVCPNGHHAPSHKKSRVVEQGRRSCSKCAKEHGVRFDTRFLLKQIQNY